jgi:hypothetical protein
MNCREFNRAVMQIVEETSRLHWDAAHARAEQAMKRPGQERLTIIPLTWKQACQFVDAMHRNHGEPRGCKFAIGVVDQAGEMHGVALCGRPVARELDDGLTAPDMCASAISPHEGPGPHHPSRFGTFAIPSATEGSHGSSGATAINCRWS